MGIPMTHSGIGVGGQAADMNQFTTIWQPLGWVLGGSPDPVPADLPVSGVIDMVEQGSVPDAPSSNTLRLLVLDDGAGKTQLAVQFAGGNPQLIAQQE
jgi:hypothetical protein